MKLVTTETLKQKVLEYQAEFQTAYESAAERAWIFGQALIELQLQIPRGEWKAWLEKNIQYSYPQVAKFMQLGATPIPPKGLAGETFNLDKAAKEAGQRQKQNHRLAPVDHSDDDDDAPPAPAVKAPPATPSLITHDQALKIIGISGHAVLVAEETLDVIFEGLTELRSDNTAALKQLQLAKTRLLP